LRTAAFDQIAVGLAARLHVELRAHGCGLLFGSCSQLLVHVYAGTHGCRQVLRLQPFAVGCPARSGQGAEVSLLLHQTADAYLRSLALLDALYVRTPELALLVNLGRWNIDAPQIALFQLAGDLAGIDPIGLDPWAWSSLHSTRCDHAHFHCALLQIPGHLITESAGFVGDVQRAVLVILEKRCNVVDPQRSAQASLFRSVPSQAVHHLGSRDIHRNPYRRACLRSGHLRLRDYLQLSYPAHGSLPSDCGGYRSLCVF
jgi:hypothetical protein